MVKKLLCITLAVLILASNMPLQSVHAKEAGGGIPPSLLEELFKNNQVNIASITGKTDHTAPTTQVAINGPFGESSFYTGTVTFTLTASDNSSGVNRTEYSLNGGTTWESYASPVSIEEDGVYVLSYRSVDHSGNVEKVKKQKISIDSTAPESPAILAVEDEVLSGEYKISIFSGSDNLSGFQKTQYRLNNDDNWTDYTAPFNVLVVNQLEVHARSIDYAGNKVETSKTLTLTPDTVPPSAPLIYILTQEWVNKDTRVRILPGVDEGSGIKRTEYRHSEADDWMTYEGSFMITTEGITDIFARSIDLADHISEVAHVQVKLDKSFPTPSIISASTQDWTNQPVTVTIIAGNDSGSGVVGSVFRTALEEEWNYYFEPLIITEEGISQVYAATEDYAGNQSAESSMEVKIDYTLPTSPVVEVQPIAWTNQFVNINITPGIDDLSGVEKTQYKLGDEGEWTEYALLLD